jgi:hypothetical protein
MRVQRRAERRFADQVPKYTASAKANETEEEVGWDSDDEDASPAPTTTTKPTSLTINPPANSSTTTLTQPLPPQATPKATSTTLQPEPQARRSHDEKSVADSEASYDIVSGAVSRAASSPKEKRGEESDEEDWE